MPDFFCNSVCIPLQYFICFLVKTEGKWNGGFAPYGCELVNGELQIAEDETEIIHLIYDKFIHTNMGISAITAWLNQHGYKKSDRITHWTHLLLPL